MNESYEFHASNFNGTTNQTSRNNVGYIEEKIQCHDVHLFSFAGEIVMRHRTFGKIQYQLHILAVIFLVVGILGNVITIATISAKSRMRTPTFTMLACLALEDLTGLFVFYIFNWTEVISLLKYCVGITHRLYGQAVVGIMLISAMNNSALHVTLLSCLRYCIVVHPIYSKLTLDCKLVMMASCICWIIIYILAIAIYLIILVIGRGDDMLIVGFQ